MTNRSAPPSFRPTASWPSRPAVVFIPLVLASAAAGACGGGGEVVTDPPESPPACAAGVSCDRVDLSPLGTAATFDVATWNLEWLGDPGNGPTDERLQQLQIAETLADAEVDIWSVQEVVTRGAFRTVVDSALDYTGLLANDAAVTGGSDYYSDFGDLEQKVGLIWRTGVLDVTGARIILTDYDFEFAGRPPLEVRADVTVGDVSFPAVFVVLHAKAGTDREDWERRTAGALALKDYLDATWPDVPVWVLGDFNDDLDVSIHAGAASPYAAFVDDPLRWRFPSQALTAAGATSTVDYNDVIDHILVSDEAWVLYQDGSAAVVELDTAIQDFGTSTSDHFPVLSRFDPAR